MAQFRAKSEELNEARVAAEDRLEAVHTRFSSRMDIERSKEVLVSHYSSLVPTGLRQLSSEERRRVYKRMRLRVFAHRDGTLIAREA